MGESGFSNPRLANFTNDTSEPEAPRELEIISIGTQGTAPDELAQIGLSFVRPRRKVLTPTEAESDDQYTITPTAATVSGNYGVGTTHVLTSVSLVGVVPIGGFVSFGALVQEHYKVAAVDPAYIDLEYGLTSPIAILDAINYCFPKIAESPTTSRALRVNTTSGQTVRVFHDTAGTVRVWEIASAFGQREDRNKILITLDDTGFKDKRQASGLLVATTGSVGQVIINLDSDPTGILNPGDMIFFDTRELTAYEVVAVTTGTVEILQPLEDPTFAGEEIFIRTATASDVADYSSLGLGGFSTFIDITAWGNISYKLYSKESAASQGALGDFRKEYESTDSLMRQYGSGINDITYNAPTTYFDGRKLYWSLTAVDRSLSTESLADLNAWAVSLPGQVHLTGITVDQDLLTTTLDFDNITLGGLNPSLSTAMGGSATQFSTGGGYDIFRRLLTAIDFSNGFYLGSSATAGTVNDSEIISGDMIFIRDIYTGHRWAVRATEAGRVTISDATLISGDTGRDYLTAFSTASLSIKRAAIVPTDSILPLAGGVTKQYLTDFSNTWIDSVMTVDDYVYTIEAVDPAGGTSGKL